MQKVRTINQTRVHSFFPLGCDPGEVYIRHIRIVVAACWVAPCYGYDVPTGKAGIHQPQHNILDQDDALVLQMPSLQAFVLEVMEALPMLEVGGC